MRRGEVRVSRGRRVAVGVEPMGKMAARFRGDRSAAVWDSLPGRREGGTLRGPNVAGSAVAEGTLGKGTGKWETDSAQAGVVSERD